MYLLFVSAANFVGFYGISFVVYFSVAESRVWNSLPESVL